MFVNETPLVALNAVQDYLTFNMANFPEEALPKLQELSRERGPADVLVKGAELLFSALLQCPNMPNQEDGWRAVGLAAYQIANSNLWARGDRGFAIMTYASFKIGGAVEGMNPPPVPSLDDEYRIVPAPVFVPPSLQAGPLAATPAPSEPTPPPPPEPEPG